MSERKYIRLALSEDDAADLAQAKETVEKQTGIAMSDAMFALSVLRHALKERGSKNE